MTEIRPNLRLAAHDGGAATSGARPRIGVVDSALDGIGSMDALARLFPHIDFQAIGSRWPDRRPAGVSALILDADADALDPAVAALSRLVPGLPVIVALRGANVAATRILMRGGAADILPLPANETTLSLSLERIVAGLETDGADGEAGEVITLLKAGGGVGATALGTQLAVLLAGQGGENSACFADLDLQFGQGALYLDLVDAFTIGDILGAGGTVGDAPLDAAVARHASGARLLAAPKEMTPLETLTPGDVEGLLAALRRSFRRTIVDLPGVWTAWTNHALQLSDRIVLITHLSVGHVSLAKRQLRVLATQGLDTKPITLVCNALGPDQQGVLSAKTAEKAIGRSFDIVIPEDRRLMIDAVAQGRPISAIRSGSKLEKGLLELARVVDPAQAPRTDKRRRLW